ncbi:unnamed protein product, partial [Prorocentrum cordatum]
SSLAPAAAGGPELAAEGEVQLLDWLDGKDAQQEGEVQLLLRWLEAVGAAPRVTARSLADQGFICQVLRDLCPTTHAEQELALGAEAPAADVAAACLSATFAAVHDAVKVDPAGMILRAVRAGGNDLEPLADVVRLWRHVLTYAVCCQARERHVLIIQGMPQDAQHRLMEIITGVEQRLGGTQPGRSRRPSSAASLACSRRPSSAASLACPEQADPQSPEMAGQGEECRNRLAQALPGEEDESRSRSIVEALLRENERLRAANCELGGQARKSRNALRMSSATIDSEIESYYLDWQLENQLREKEAQVQLLKQQIERGRCMVENAEQLQDELVLARSREAEHKATQQRLEWCNLRLEQVGGMKQELLACIDAKEELSRENDTLRMQVTQLKQNGQMLETFKGRVMDLELLNKDCQTRLREAGARADCAESERQRLAGEKTLLEEQLLQTQMDLNALKEGAPSSAESGGVVEPFTQKLRDKMRALESQNACLQEQLTLEGSQKVAELQVDAECARGLRDQFERQFLDASAQLREKEEQVQLLKQDIEHGRCMVEHAKQLQDELVMARSSEAEHKATCKLHLKQAEGMKQELQACIDAKEELSRENDTLRMQVTQLKQNGQMLETFKGRVMDLELLNKDCQTRLREAGARADCAESERQRLAGEKTLLEEQLLQTQMDLNALKEGAPSSAESGGVVEPFTQKLRDKMRALESQNACLQEQLTLEGSQKVAELQVDAECARGLRDQFERQFLDASAQLREKEEQVQLLKQDIEHGRCMVENAKQLQDELVMARSSEAEHKATCKLHLKQAEGMKQELQACIDAKEELSRENDTLRMQVTQLKQNGQMLETFKGRVMDLELLNKDCQTRLREAGARADCAESERQRLAGEKTLLEEQLLQTQMDLNALKEGAPSSAESGGVVEPFTQKLRDKMRALESQNACLQEQLTLEGSQKVAELQVDAECARGLRDQFERQFLDASAQLRDERQRVEALLAQGAELREQLRSAEGRAEEADRRAGSTEQELVAVRQRCTTQEEAVLLVRARSAALEAELGEARAARRAAREREEGELEESPRPGREGPVHSSGPVEREAADLEAAQGRARWLEAEAGDLRKGLAQAREAAEEARQDLEVQKGQLEEELQRQRETEGGGLAGAGRGAARGAGRARGAGGGGRGAGGPAGRRARGRPERLGAGAGPWQPHAPRGARGGLCACAVRPPGPHGGPPRQPRGGGEAQPLPRRAAARRGGVGQPPGGDAAARRALGAGAPGARPGRQRSVRAARVRGGAAAGGELPAPRGAQRAATARRRGGDALGAGERDRGVRRCGGSARANANARPRSTAAGAVVYLHLVEIVDALRVVHELVGGGWWRYRCGH